MTSQGLPRDATADRPTALCIQPGIPSDVFQVRGPAPLTQRNPAKSGPGEADVRLVRHCRAAAEMVLRRDRGRFRTWLYRVVRHKAADQLRRRTRTTAEAFCTARSRGGELEAHDTDPATLSYRPPAPVQLPFDKG